MAYGPRETHHDETPTSPYPQNREQSYPDALSLFEIENPRVSPEHLSSAAPTKPTTPSIHRDWRTHLPEHEQMLTNIFLTIPPPHPLAPASTTHYEAPLPSMVGIFRSGLHYCQGYTALTVRQSWAVSMGGSVLFQDSRGANSSSPGNQRSSSAGIATTQRVNAER